MEFSGLPPEVVLKIFSYLPQDLLEVIARVSQRWMKLTFCASVYTVMCIPSGHSDSLQQVQKILERATMLLMLQITPEAADFDIGSTASTGLRHLDHLVIPGSGISRGDMSGIVEHCKSLAATMLYCQHRLAATDVHIFETLLTLRRFVRSNDVEIDDGVLQQLRYSRPRLEILEVNSEHISRNENWDYSGSLQQLRILALNVLPTADSLHVPKSCPLLATLEIVEVVVKE